MHKNFKKLCGPNVSDAKSWFGSYCSSRLVVSAMYSRSPLEAPWVVGGTIHKGSLSQWLKYMWIMTPGLLSLFAPFPQSLREPLHLIWLLRRKTTITEIALLAIFLAPVLLSITAGTALSPYLSYMFHNFRDNIFQWEDFQILYVEKQE